MRRRVLTAVCLLPWVLAAQDVNKLGVPNPPKPDIPYLIQASQLVELEQGEAFEEEKKNELRFWVAGGTARVKTPLAAPEFLFDSADIDPRDLKLYGFEVVKGRREILFRKKKKVVAEPYFLQLEGIEARVVRIRINASLAPGEYCLTPDGQNTVFTFAVF